MNRHAPAFRRLLWAAACGALALPAAAPAADWLAEPSYYTHDPQSGQRVQQYEEVGPFYIVERPDYLKSGYRDYRSSLQVGGSADHLHVVEEWGRPVRPYDEWRFPFRPYSVPYDLWGPPMWGGGFGPFGGIGVGGVGGVGAVGGGGQPGNVYGSYGFDVRAGFERAGAPPPYYDGNWGRSRIPPRLEDRPPPPVPPAPGATINIGNGNTGAVTVDNGVTGDGNNNNVNGNNNQFGP